MRGCHVKSQISSRPWRYNRYIKMSAKKNVLEQWRACGEIVNSANVCLEMKKKNWTSNKTKKKEQTWEIQVNYQLVQPKFQSLNTRGGSACESSWGLCLASQWILVCDILALHLVQVVLSPQSPLESPEDTERVALTLHCSPDIEKHIIKSRELQPSLRHNI